MNRTGTTVTLALAAAALGGCDDVGVGVLGTEPDRMEVRLDGPISSLGSWRYYDGVRLLECDTRLTARGDGARSAARARWVEGVVDVYDLYDGRYLGSDWFDASDLRWLFGSSTIRAGERRTARSLRYNSWGPFRLEFSFRYRIEETGDYDRAEYTSDCR